MLVKNIAVMKSHSELKREYGDLLSERLAVRELISDLNRMKVLDQQIRKSLTGDLKLDDSHNHYPESNYRELEKDHITGYNIASIPSQIPVSGYLTQKIELSSDFKTNKKEKFINRRTGLLIDPYFSATKIKWILDLSLIHI